MLLKALGMKEKMVPDFSCCHLTCLLKFRKTVVNTEPQDLEEETDSDGGSKKLYEYGGI